MEHLIMFMHGPIVKELSFVGQKARLKGREPHYSISEVCLIYGSALQNCESKLVSPLFPNLPLCSSQVLV